MSLLDIFSKRQKRLRGEMPDIYSYDELPQPLKVQIIHIWRDTLGDEDAYLDIYRGTRVAYQFIVEALRREYGVFALPGSTEPFADRGYLSELANFLLTEQDTERVLDAVELSFRAIDAITRNPGYLQRSNASEVADAAIEELNGRFREHAVGYQFVDGHIIRLIQNCFTLKR